MISMYTGNIRVFGRLRPSIAEDGNGLSAQLVCRVDSEDDAVLHVLSKGLLFVSFSHKMYVYVLQSIYQVIIACR